MIQLRPYQQQLKADIYDAWRAGHRNVLAVMPTGAGKTVSFSDIVREHVGASVAIAHRQELVSQISLSFARFEISHRIIGPKAIIGHAMETHHRELGRSFYDPSAPAAVAGVDTLGARAESLGRWAQQVTLWINDEAHHLLTINKWGNAVALFPNAFGLGVTATPGRADGRGLGRAPLGAGVFDVMVDGPSMRDLIDAGSLSDYRIFAPPSDLDVASVPVSAATGDFVAEKLREASHRSHIVGDVVEHYLRVAPGKPGITFAVDVETAQNIANNYRRVGVPAECVSAKTPDRVRDEFIRRFRAGDIKQLVNVDLFGEGFDVPALVVVSMARPTMSFPVYGQQFGRACRVFDGKLAGIIIDHVGNVQRHGLPDSPRSWSLASRERGTRAQRDPDVLPITACTTCFRAFQAITQTCPHCGAYQEPASRAGPQFVAGDLHELSPEALAKLRADVARADETTDQVRARVAAVAGALAGAGAANRHAEKQAAQRALRDAIALWAGWQKYEGREDSESYRRFFHRFGMDVLTAQALPRVEAEKLTGELRRVMGIEG